MPEPKQWEYIYALYTTHESDPFYIGRTHDTKTRLSQHINESLRGCNTQKCLFIQQAIANGLDINIKVIIRRPYGQLGDLEYEIIEAYGMEKKLMNSRAGDNLNRMSAEQARILREAIAEWKRREKKSKKRKADNIKLPVWTPDTKPPAHAFATNPETTAKQNKWAERVFSR